MLSFRCRVVLQNNKNRLAALGLKTGGLALHKLISLLMVKAVMISLIYFSLLAAKPASVVSAARAAAGAADALHNSTPNSQHRRAAGRETSAHQTPLPTKHHPSPLVKQYFHLFVQYCSIIPPIKLCPHTFLLPAHPAQGNPAGVSRRCSGCARSPGCR